MIEKKLIKYIMPNVLAMAGISCYILADTFFIAKAEGANGITALNLILPLYGIIYALGAMIGIGSATRFSLQRAIGVKNADKYFSNAVIWASIVGLVFVAAGVFIPDTILRIMGADDTILNVGLPYLKTVMPFAPFFIINYTFTSFVRNDGAPNIAMAATILSGIFNIIFDYIFMFPLKMGMVGAALATGISPIVSMLICMAHFLSKKNTIKFVKKMPSLMRLVNSCELGVVAFVGEVSNGITTMVFNFILLDLVGNVAVAAYGVIANVAIVGMALLNGVSQGLQPLASTTHGEGNPDDEKRIYKKSLQIAFLIAVALVVVVLVFGDHVVSVFNSENSVELAYYAESGIRLYFLGFLVAAVNLIMAGFYSATGRAKEASIISISRGVVAIVVFAVLLSKLFGVVGVWLAFLVAELFTHILIKVLIRVKKLAKRQ